MKIQKRLITVVTFLCLVALPVLSASADGLKGAGTEDRDWITGPEDPTVSPRTYDITEQREVSITMSDGVVLKADIFHPDLPQDSEPPPCVLLADGYGRPSFFESILTDLAKRGYAGVHVGLRGVPPSGGENNLYNLYGQDGYDLVEWIAQQPWCNGKVGMVGSSLLGISQWLTAKEAPPSLEAISPHVACGDCYGVLWYPGGMLPGPGRVARGEPEYSSAIEHRNYDDWWRERSTIAKDHKAISRRRIAAMISGGWDDYITPANVKAYEQFKGRRKKLIIGPWAHTSTDGLLPYDYTSYQVFWLDHWLKGVDNGVNREPKVLIYVKGPNVWRFERKWPIPDTHHLRLYLMSSESGTVNSLNDGTLGRKRPGKHDTAVSYDYSPDTGPFLHTMLDMITGRLVDDQRPEEEFCLTWTTDALGVPTEVTGWVELKFWAATTAEDTDFVVQMTDVAPDGYSTQVTCGYLNASRYFSRSEPEPLVSGKIYKYKVELWPTSYVFQAGHRIRLDLAGASMPAEGQFSPQGPGIHPNPATVTVYQGAHHRSHIKLPIIGTGWKDIAGK